MKISLMLITLLSSLAIAKTRGYRWEHVGDRSPNKCFGTKQGGDSNPHIVNNPRDNGEYCDRHNAGSYYCDAGKAANGTYVDRYWRCQAGRSENREYAWRRLGDFAPNRCRGTAQAGDSNPYIVRNPEELDLQCNHHVFGERFCDAGKSANGSFVDRYWECDRK